MSAFKGISYSQIHTLCQLVCKASEGQKQTIELLFAEKHLNFVPTLTLIQAIGLVTDADNKLIRTSKLEKIYKEDGVDSQLLKKAVLEYLTKESIEFHQFNCRFTLDENAIPEQSNITHDSVGFSTIRNLLLDLEYIEFDYLNRTYKVSPQYQDRFHEIVRSSKTNQETFLLRKSEHESIGLLAELEVIAYEQRKLGNLNHLCAIEHISQSDVRAGYDIKSYEVIQTSPIEILPKYIEVKAVSNDDYKFYLTRNEMDQAKILGKRYFLYLLPCSKNIFQIEKMIIIRNPYETLFINNNSEWQRREELFSFFQIR